MGCWDVVCVCVCVTCIKEEGDERERQKEREGNEMGISLASVLCVWKKQQWFKYNGVIFILIWYFHVSEFTVKEESRILVMLLQPLFSEKYG